LRVSVCMLKGNERGTREQRGSLFNESVNNARNLKTKRGGWGIVSLQLAYPGKLPEMGLWGKRKSVCTR